MDTCFTCASDRFSLKRRHPNCIPAPLSQRYLAPRLLNLPPASAYPSRQSPARRPHLYARHSLNTLLFLALLAARARRINPSDVVHSHNLPCLRQLHRLIYLRYVTSNCSSTSLPPCAALVGGCSLRPLNGELNTLTPSFLHSSRALVSPPRLRPLSHRSELGTWGSLGRAELLIPLDQQWEASTQLEPCWQK